MFEKIFGIFRKRKKSDVSQDIPGDLGEETFGGDTGFEEDFDADTISLETGISGDSGFESGGASGGDVGTPSGEPGPGMDLEGDTAGIMEEAPSLETEGPISPPPEVEAYASPKRKRGFKEVLVTAAIVVACLAIGFFGVQPGIKIAQKALSSGPTLEEQLTALQSENAQLESQLAAYRAVGNIDAITAIRDELKTRSGLVEQTKQIEAKVADRPLVEKQFDTVGSQLERTLLELVIQKGALANAEKAVKQVEARNNYFISSTKTSLEQITSAGVKAQVLKERLDPATIEQAEAAGMLHYSIRKNLEESMLEAPPSSS
jgi:hypothetical protein